MFSTTALYRRSVASCIFHSTKSNNTVSLSSSGTLLSSIQLRTFANDPTFGATPTPFYSPTLTSLRPGEAGRGGRSSEAGCKFVQN
jgi:hypothetical protein